MAQEWDFGQHQHFEEARENEPAKGIEEEPSEILERNPEKKRAKESPKWKNTLESSNMEEEPLEFACGQVEYDIWKTPSNEHLQSLH